MPLVTYYKQLFKCNPVPTERTVYELMKKHTPPTHITYIAAPWSTFFKKKMSLNNIKIPHCNNGITVCQHVRYEELIPLLLQHGIETIFTPHAHGHRDDIRVLPFPHAAVNSGKPSMKKDIFYSFIGADTTALINSQLRRNIFNLQHLPQALVIEHEEFHWRIISEQSLWQKIRKILTQDEKRRRLEYIDTLRRSRFSLCPRGFGISTIRFWESLQAGAIPVLFSDEMQLPTGIDWSECILQIPENQVESIIEKIADIPQDKELSMRKACLQAHQTFTGKNLLTYMYTHFPQ